MDKLWSFHANQTSMCLDPYQNSGRGTSRYLDDLLNIGNPY